MHEEFPEFDGQDIDKLHDSTDKAVAIVYWARWCDPCIKLRKFFSDVKKRCPDVEFFWQNVDEHPTMIDSDNEDFQIRAIPSILVFESREYKKKIDGFYSVDKLVGELNNL